MKLHFREQAQSFELLRAVSYGGYQGAELGECLATAERIRPTSGESWFMEWEKTARRVEAIGRTCLSAGHIVSGREALLRASNYYRTAEFFLPPDDKRRPDSYRKSVDTFVEAMALLPISYERVRIPYEDTFMPGYYYRALGHEDSGTPGKTLIFVGGFDSTAEELYFAGAAAAVKRGYHCLIFDGPGQGQLLREQHISARPDWEVPVGAAIDFLTARPEVDPDRIVLMGMSLGGYYAPRAAAFDARIRACICYDIFFDLWQSVVNKSPRLISVLRYPRWLMNAAVKAGMRRDLGVQWQINNAMWVFGAADITQLESIMKPYTLAPIIHKIGCPMLLLAGEQDHFVPLPQAYSMRDLLQCDATLHIFTREEGAEEHCQEGNHARFHQVAFDWLDERMA